MRDHGGNGRPVVFVPSLINPAFVLDIAPGRSLVQHVADAGFHAWLVDWGEPRPQDAALDLGGHVARRLLPLIAKLDSPPILVGYCLGGTLALAAAALLCDRAAGVATIAAPWRFGGYGAEARAEMLRLWNTARAPAETMGVLPMEVLQSGFWRLDPARTVAKYAVFATMDEREAGTFVALEDWANAGAPLTFGAARELFENLIRDDLPGGGTWKVEGRTIDPATLPCPAAEFVSLTDRITPAATAAGLSDRCELAAGHVGMVVGSKSRAMLWEPLTRWIARI